MTNRVTFPACGFIGGRFTRRRSIVGLYTQSRDESIIRSIELVNRDGNFPVSSISRISRAEGVEKKVILFYGYSKSIEDCRVVKHTRSSFINCSNCPPIRITIETLSRGELGSIDRSITILLRSVVEGCV